LDEVELIKAVLALIALGLVVAGMIVAFLSLFIEDLRPFVALTFLFWVAIGLLASSKLRERRQS